MLKKIIGSQQSILISYEFAVKANGLAYGLGTASWGWITPKDNQYLEQTLNGDYQNDTRVNADMLNNEITITNYAQKHGK